MKSLLRVQRPTQLGKCQFKGQHPVPCCMSWGKSLGLSEPPLIVGSQHHYIILGVQGTFKNTLHIFLPSFHTTPQHFVIAPRKTPCLKFSMLKFSASLWHEINCLHLI